MLIQRTCRSASPREVIVGNIANGTMRSRRRSRPSRAWKQRREARAGGYGLHSQASGREWSERALLACRPKHMSSILTVECWDTQVNLPGIRCSQHPESHPQGWHNRLPLAADWSATEIISEHTLASLHNQSIPVPFGNIGTVPYAGDPVIQYMLARTAAAGNPASLMVSACVPLQCVAAVHCSSNLNNPRASKSN